jgi:hypothetical protein
MTGSVQRDAVSWILSACDLNREAIGFLQALFFPPKWAGNWKTLSSESSLIVFEREDTSAFWRKFADTVAENLNKWMKVTVARPTRGI